MTWTLASSSDSCLTFRSEGGAIAVVSAAGVSIDGSPEVGWDVLERWCNQVGIECAAEPEPAR